MCPSHNNLRRDLISLCPMDLSTRWPPWVAHRLREQHLNSQYLVRLPQSPLLYDHKMPLGQRTHLLPGNSAGIRMVTMTTFSSQNQINLSWHNTNLPKHKATRWLQQNPSLKLKTGSKTMPTRSWTTIHTQRPFHNLPSRRVTT